MQAAHSTATVPSAERAFHGIVAAMLAGVFVAGFAGIDRWFPVPVAGGSDGPVRTVCLMRLLTGIPCPTCGMTRSLCSIGRGELAESFALHPLGPVVYAIFALAMVRSARIALLSRPCLDRAAHALVCLIPLLGLAAGVLWIVRLWHLTAAGAAAEAWRASPLAALLAGQ